MATKPRLGIKARVSVPPTKPRSAVPLGMLSLLMLAFGGSLALKAFEERQFADSAILAQQVREVEALAGHVRAELIAYEPVPQWVSGCGFVELKVA